MGLIHSCLMSLERMFKFLKMSSPEPILGQFHRQSIFFGISGNVVKGQGQDYDFHLKCPIPQFYCVYLTCFSSAIGEKIIKPISVACFDPFC